MPRSPHCHPPPGAGTIVPHRPPPLHLRELAPPWLTPVSVLLPSTSGGWHHRASPPSSPPPPGAGTIVPRRPPPLHLRGQAPSCLAPAFVLLPVASTSVPDHKGIHRRRSKGSLQYPHLEGHTASLTANLTCTTSPGNWTLISAAGFAWPAVSRCGSSVVGLPHAPIVSRSGGPAVVC